MQHLEAMRRFIMGDSNYCLILEDDSLPKITQKDKFQESINSLLNNHLPKAFFLDISSSLGLIPYNQDNTHQNLQRMAYGQTRCASSYILSRETVKILLSTIDFIGLPIDWLLTYYFVNLRIHTYWSQDALFIQGSETGTFKSNQLARNQL